LKDGFEEGQFCGRLIVEGKLYEGFFLTGLFEGSAASSNQEHAFG